MKLLILGGSNSQLNAIIHAKQKGHTVIVSDYLENAPGKKLADCSENTSTFDIEGNIQIGKKYNIDGVMTVGTDQPIYTAARVAEALELPTFLDVDTAKAVTNKKVMKTCFTEYHIPTVKYKFIKADFDDQDLAELRLPVVIKPLDSQGQRGVYKLDTIADIRKNFQDVLSYSREEEILVEEFYESEEITVNGWVKNDEVFVLSIVDRISYNNYPHIGVCIGHHFPSKFMKDYYEEIVDITEQIVKAFRIHEGPIYFQMLIGQDGIKVNEIAARIGGAYEDEYLPRVTGVNILDMVIDHSVQKEYDGSALGKFDLYRTEKKISVEMYFARPCTIHGLNDMNRLLQLPGVLQARHNFSIGRQIKEMTNATQRAGYMIIEGNSSAELQRNIARAYDVLGIYDDSGKNMIMRFNQYTL
ncbi:MAG: ATP-grasp domain-containing protein [Bacillota bacterium]